MKSSRIWPFAFVVLGACVGSLAGTGPEEYDLADAELRVAFVGNSLTYVGNVPGLVQRLADLDGRSMSHVAIAYPDVSLSDHWYAGTQEVLRDLEPDVVVLQQGPSTSPANMEHLMEWSRRFDGVMAEWGGEPALYMVWPSKARRDAFPLVWASYRAAARAADGAFIPAGQTWVEAWTLDPGLALYSSDGYHQNDLGALAAAMTIYAVLWDVPAEAVPVPEGVPEATWSVLRTALAESLIRADTAGWGRP